MKNVKFIFVLLSFLMLPLNAYAQDQVMENPSLEIHSPYAFATTSNAPMGAAFLKIVNKGMNDDILIEAKSNVSEFTEIHQNYIDEDDGTMMMRKVLNIPVSAGGQAVLKPTGNHIMLVKLKQQLRLEDSFDLTLVFKQAGEITVNVNIIPPGTQPIESMQSTHDKIEELIIKMDSDEPPAMDHSQMDHSGHQQKATGDTVNLLKPRVPYDLGKSGVRPNVVPQKDDFIQESSDQVNRILLEDGSNYEEDINFENLDIENFE